jgi:MoxR-like ATPase
MSNEDKIEFNPRLDFTNLNEKVEALKAEMAKCLVGQTAMAELLLTAILADGHVLIEGVPGIAKTLTAKLLARTIATSYSRIQFTPDLMPSDVIGTSIFHPASGNFVFRKGPVFSNIVLIDEINRAPAKTQSALFEVMEERQISYDGITYPLEFPFIILATQNPVDHEGTYRLPEAQLDRFMFKIDITYPSQAEELQILELHSQSQGVINQLDSVQAVLSPEEISTFRKLAGEVHVEPRLKEYIVSIVAATRNHPFLYLGASPRASLALMHASKALAALRGKDFIVPEDIQEVAFPVLRHRIILSPEKEMEGLTNDEVIRQILRKIEVPR